MLQRCIYPLRILLAYAVLLLSLAVPISSHAGVTLRFIPIEEAKFLVRGEGWERGDLVHLTMDYDTTYLSAPQLTVMGGKLGTEAHGKTPSGRLQLNILNEEQSPIFEACIFFQKQGDYPAVINFVTAEVTGLAGTQQLVPVSMIANPNIPQSNPADISEEKPAEILDQQTAQRGECE